MQRNTEGLKISIVNVLKIPTIWFSFMAFIVATVCNGFLSINLEPKVGYTVSLRYFKDNQRFFDHPLTLTYLWLS